MSGDLPLFITACADRSVTHYEYSEGWSCITVSGDQGISVIGASGLKLKPSKHEGSRSEEHRGGEDFGVMECDSVFENVFGMEGRSGKVRCG